MHKVLWDAVIKCRVMWVSINEQSAYCAGCTLGKQCDLYGEEDTLHAERKEVKE